MIWEIIKSVLDLILRWAVPFLLGWLVSLIRDIKAEHKERQKQDTARDESIGMGLQCLLRAEIIRSSEKYHDKGYCPIYAREALKRAYTAYHNLGGNDVATDLYHRTMALPSDPEKEDA